MPTHSSLTGADLHEPKGVAAASAEEVYVADGGGSGAWESANPHGGWRYADIGTGTTFTTPTAYAIMNVVGATTHLHEFTNNSLGRLTYTGTPARHVFLTVNMNIKHSAGSGQDIFFEVYKNGLATGDESVVTADSANYLSHNIHYDAVASNGDYFEIYLKASGGNVIVHQAGMGILGVPG